MSENKRTALYDVHRKLGAKVIPFGGWDMPVEYSGIAKEHTAVRMAAGLFDVSHMGEFDVRGPQALDLIQHVTTNDASTIVPGQAQYTAMAYPEGTVVDDLLVYFIDRDHYMLVVNAANIRKDLEWILSNNGFDATVTDLSDNTALLALQGPRAADILRSLTDMDLDAIGNYRFAPRARVLGVPVILSRTGYTGEDGFELYFAPERAEHLWHGLLGAGRPYGVLPAGLGARNTLRLEAKMLLYGNDMDQTTTLLEAALGWIVKFDKGEFVGRRALLEQKERGVRRKLVGFEMLGRDIARDHYPACVNGRQVGHVTSGSPSITLKKNIGLAYLPAEHSATGTCFQVRVRERLSDARVVPTPFYKRR